MAGVPRWPYWGRFAALTVASLSLLFLFIFGFLPQRFLLELDFTESGFSYPVIKPPLPAAPLPPPLAERRPTPRGPAERFWAEYLELTRAGDGDGALRLLEEYLARHPGDWGVRLEYARALWRQGRLDDAMGAYRAVLARRGDLEVERELAHLYVAARRWDAALKLYEKMARAAPQDTDLLRELAEVAVWAERYGRAAEVYERLVELFPDDPELRLRWARVLYWSGRPEQAARVLDGLPPDFDSAALEALRSAIELSLPPRSEDYAPSPEVGPEPLELARGLAMEGAADSALAIYRRLLEEGPEAHGLLLEIADVFEYRANAPDSAIAYLRAYIEVEPESHEARLRLARLLAWSGELAAAEAELNRYLSSQPDDAAAWATLGEVLRWRGQRGPAVQAYRRALMIVPAEPTASAGMASVQALVDTELAARGIIGPAGGFEYFSDSDDFASLRLRGGWLTGSPRLRGGLDAELEEIRGFDLASELSDLTAIGVQAVGESWLGDGSFHGAAAFGAWVPSGGVSAQPTAHLSLSAPNLGGSAFQLEYRHGPAHVETATLEAALAGLRVDMAALRVYRPLGGRWELASGGRVTRYSGAGDSNLRADAALGIFYRPDANWLLGYDGRLLGFTDPAPAPGRRLYWDPKWSWESTLLLAWRAAPGPAWELEARLSPGLAWVEERDLDPAVAVLLGAILNARYHLDVWTVEGRAGFNQSRAGGYRSFQLELAVSRRFGL
ncbi:MAG: tetratricopeptide repeat protein [Gemmatimonadota bacterium]|nr:MAG: tetratricopeptide repeat protein [Gemmatimonadota bacterium]